MSPSTSFLEKIPIFSGLSAAELAAIGAVGQTRRHQKGEVVFQEGEWDDALYVILEGRVRVYVCGSRDKEFVLNTMGPGEYFGELALLDGERRSASISTLEDCTFHVIAKAMFFELMRGCPSLSEVLVGNLVRRIRHLTESVRGLALDDVYGRLRALLLSLAEPQGGVRKVQECMTQQEIANRVGSSREMVTRILKDLTTGGYISVVGKRIHILRDLPESY